MSTRRKGHLLLAAVPLAAALYLAVPATSTLEQDAGDDVKRVHTARVEAMDSQRELRFAGVTRAARRAQLSFLLGGRLEARPVEVGDTVRAGQVLARLDAREVRNAVDAASAQVAELEARRNQANRDVERVESLVEAKAATSEELEQVRAGLDALSAVQDSARVRLKEARRQLGETTLTAPYAGSVMAVHAQPGEFVQPGRTVLTLSGQDSVELEVEVPESVVPQLTVGATVSVRLPALGTTRAARITSLGRAAAGPGQLFPVLVQFDPAPLDSTARPSTVAPAAVKEPTLRPGMTAELVLELASPFGLTLPVEAVINPGGRQPAVFQVRSDGTVRRVEVQVGRLLGERVTVQGDLTVGDEVVVGGQRGLLDGEKVLTAPAPGAQR